MFNVLYLGQKPIGERCFDILLKDKSFNIRGAVSNKNIKDNWWKSNEVFVNSKTNNIRFIENNNRNEHNIINLIHKENINLIISVQHSWIISEQIINLVDGNALNLHLAILPDYKAWNSFSHAIINGEKKYGTTIHWMTRELDEGAIALQKTFKIQPNDTAKSLYQKTYKISYLLFSQFLLKLKQKKLKKIKQKSEGRQYNKHSLDEYRYIPLNKLNEKSDTIIRALYFPPYPPAYTIINNKKVELIPKSD